MTDARQLIEAIRNELKPVEEAIVRHRYLEALRTGRVSQQALRIFAGQQYHIIASDLRSIALLLSRHGDLPSRAYLLGVLQGENTAFEALAHFARALGMGDADLHTSEPIPSAFAYSAFVAWLGLYGSDAELSAAFAANFAAWGANCGQMGSALKTQYGFEPDAVAFFDLFANLAT
jgi:thiaminase